MTELVPEHQEILGAGKMEMFTRLIVSRVLVGIRRPIAGRSLRTLLAAKVSVLLG